MYYRFPNIRNLQEVLDVVGDLKEFIVAERDHYTVINYVLADKDTFPEVESEADAIRRECRGLVFDKEGNVLSRRLHKFFNVNEREETLLENLDVSKPHFILEKLDGSMVTPLMINGNVRWATKMGITDTSMQVENWLAEDLEWNTHRYIKLAHDMHDKGFTPIFEWCSRQNRIVVDHPEDRLVLLAVRDNLSGRYCGYHTLKALAEDYNIELVNGYRADGSNLDDIIAEVANREGEEGVVIRFEDGHMVKVKSEWYVRLHRVKEMIRSERHVLILLMEGGVDDAKSFMLDEDRKHVEDYEHQFHEWYTNKIGHLEYIYGNWADKNRKDFALWAIRDGNLDQATAGMIFGMMDGKSPEEVLDIAINKGLTRDVKFASMKPLLMPDIEYRPSGPQDQAE